MDGAGGVGLEMGGMGGMGIMGRLEFGTVE